MLTTDTPEIVRLAALTREFGQHAPDVRNIAHGALLSAIHSANPGANHDNVERVAAELTRPPI